LTIENSSTDSVTNTSKPRPASPSTAGPLSGGLGIIVFLALFGAAGYLTYKTLTTAPIPEAEPIPGTFMCIVTNKIFEHSMNEGDHWPVLSPFSQKKSGYPVERCFWTPDGKRKETPDYVVLKETLGKSGDTICPVCGRIVLGHNPVPDETVPLETPASAPAEDKTATAAPTTQPAD
jgi:hypothetical protein